MQNEQSFYILNFTLFPHSRLRSLRLLAVLFIAHRQLLRLIFRFPACCALLFIAHCKPVRVNILLLRLLALALLLISIVFHNYI
jgi:hypothetical protein